MTDAKIHLLIVDDEIDIREILQFNLENEGYLVDLADSAEQALEKIQNSTYHLILLDVMMGGISGYKMAEKLRKNNNDIPIIFLTAKNTENDVLTGFSIGADDFITKPFSVKEVIARVKSILKRTGKVDDSIINKSSIIIVKNLSIDIDRKEVCIDDQSVNLTKTEFEILLLLLKNQNKLFSRNDILTKVWHEDEYVLERTVDVHIARLRKKIGDYGKFIINKTGYGYCFSH
ncbi:response regulator transcription factor [Apibacter muscae]|uniref:Response regulator transcription factor n=1 Tax=Apibacter muscae TaxID=2509004 RepID=A0A563DC56_9FLAO|nr:response regulator transcription factor [Apibacter muscae]TWP27354.1 response regulator transcription factor [Apibacter muscae]TWP28574.1 response regulator transcription factor [Apibacter muscae]